MNQKFAIVAGILILFGALAGGLFTQFGVTASPVTYNSVGSGLSTFVTVYLAV